MYVLIWLGWGIMFGWINLCKYVFCCMGEMVGNWLFLFWLLIDMYIIKVYNKLLLKI